MLETLSTHPLARSEPSEGSPAVFSHGLIWTFSRDLTTGLAGETPEKDRSLSLGHLHSHIEPLQRMSRDYLELSARLKAALVTFVSFDFGIPTKKVWVKLIYIIHNIVTLGTSVAILEALADTLETAGRRKNSNNQSNFNRGPRTSRRSGPEWTVETVWATSNHVKLDKTVLKMLTCKCKTT